MDIDKCLSIMHTCSARGGVDASNARQVTILRVLTLTCLPARSVIHGFASGHPLLRSNRPLFPRLLMSWSGFATKGVEKTQVGSELSGVIVFVAGSQAT